MKDIKPGNTALLVMDVQEAIVKSLKEPDIFFKKLNSAIQVARKNKLQIIYVVVGFRSGYPELSHNSKWLTSLRSRNMNLDRAEGIKISETVTPKEDDIIVTKKRVSAFAGSDLEIILRAKNIRRLILTGIATGGVVLSTLREAADKDFEILVLSDCCADADEEVHRILTTKIFPRQAEVATSDEWTKLL